MRAPCPWPNMGQSKLSPALACMETFWINESKPLELKSFSGICAPPVHMSVEVNVLWMKSCFTSIHHGLPAWSAICYRLLHASFSDAATSRHAAITFARSALLMVELDAAWDSPRRNDVEGSCAMRKKDCHQMPIIKCQWMICEHGRQRII